VSEVILFTGVIAAMLEVMQRYRSVMS